MYTGAQFECNSQPSCKYFHGLCLSTHDHLQHQCPFSNSDESDLCLGWFGSVQRAFVFTNAP